MDQGVYVGIDEAGYGPTLGPLVAAAAWFAPPGGNPGRVPRVLGAACPRVADSKRVYTPRKGIGMIEDVLRPFLHAWCSGPPGSFSRLVRILTGRTPEDTFEGVPWYAGTDLDLPLSGRGKEAAGPVPADLGPCGAVVRVVPVPLFNRLIREGRNKGTLLFSVVCGLVRDVLRARPGTADLVVSVDRLGGRRFYGRLLHEQFPGRRVRVRKETAGESVYLVEGGGTGMTISFRVKADRDDACVGLASLAAKYVRELCMAVFNRHFLSLFPGLRPTHGYPADARRFLAEISSRGFGGETDSLVRVC